MHVEMDSVTLKPQFCRVRDPEFLSRSPRLDIHANSGSFYT